MLYAPFLFSLSSISVSQIYVLVPRHQTVVSLSLSLLLSLRLSPEFVVYTEYSLAGEQSIVNTTDMRPRQVSRVVLSKWQSEGRGARVRRSIGRPELRNLDPFLLLDEFEGSGRDGAGFPDHPHRGFETVSYLLEGEFTHEDFSGLALMTRPRVQGV